MKIISLSLCLLSTLASPLAQAKKLDPIKMQLQRSQTYMLANISPHNGLAGSILASPSIWEPNYYFHWVRDAALITSVLVDNYILSSDPIVKNLMLKNLQDSVNFDRQIQQTPNLSGGLGEPKFMVTADPFNDPWGRPQYDGPALRAISAIRLAQQLRQENQNTKLQEQLKVLIETDLDFIAQNWQQDGFDIWEETYGQHFYTHMVQYKSLQLGSLYFRSLGDDSRAQYYINEKQKIKTTLNDYFSIEKNKIIPTLPHPSGLGIKLSQLDSAVLLAFLHSQIMGLNNDLLLSTVEQLRQAFAKKYLINHQKALTMLGRYPEDVYDGIGMQATGGNPWFITTHALAELHCQLAHEIKMGSEVKATPGRISFLKSFLDADIIQRLENKENIKDTKTLQIIIHQLQEQGLNYLLLSLQYEAGEGHFSEQIHRETGLQQGAKDLSWSYSSFITATRACGIN